MKHLACTRLKYFREKANLTQAALAALVDVEPADIVDYENGRAEPQMQTYAKLAYALSVSTDELTVFED